MIYLRNFKELSRKRSEVLSDIRNHRFRLIEHLLKVFYYRDNDSLGVWLNEIRAYLGEVSKIKKSTGKDHYPTKEDIYKEAIGKDLDSLEGFHDTCIINFYSDEENPLPKVKKNRRAEDFCIDYVEWVSEVLSKKGSVTSLEVRTEIERLWSKYPYRRI